MQLSKAYIIQILSCRLSMNKGLFKV